MSSEVVDLTPVQAAAWLQQRLERASVALEAGDVSSALDAYISAVGFSLQLGPAAAQGTLGETVTAAKKWARLEEAGALSALGPALVAVADEIMRSETVSASPVMGAWAMVTSEVGALVGQVGLAVGVECAHRASMLRHALPRARLLDEITDHRFEMDLWIQNLFAGAGAG